VNSPVFEVNLIDSVLVGSLHQSPTYDESIWFLLLLQKIVLKVDITSDRCKAGAMSKIAGIEGTCE
jgi:hypothetical protein